MLGILNIATIMICTALMTLVVAMALTFMWIFEKREKAVGWWCLAMWVGTLASALLSLRSVTPWWFGIGLGNAVALMAYGLIAAGFASFAGARMRRPTIFAGAALWIVCVYGFPSIRNDINDRIIVSALGICFYSALVVHQSWQLWQRERLPSLMAATFFYASHGLFYLSRIPMVIASPVGEVSLDYGSLWYAVVTLEAFIHVMFSSFVFVALVRERAERRYRLAAEIDSLTSVASRRFFVSETHALLSRKPKVGMLAVLDLDFFKKINDTYGHMAGDRALQVFARHVSGELGPGMVFGRLGGEEFGLFMLNLPEQEAFQFLDRLRVGVEALDIHFNGHVLKVTTSIGAASVDDCGFDFDHLMAGADNALYISKHEGRNRVTAFRPAMRLHAISQGGEESRVSLAKGRVSRISIRHRPGRA